MNSRLSVAACMRDSRGYFFLARRKDEGDMALRWELPGGKAEGLETDQEALVRELAEELDLAVEIGQLLGSTSFQHNGKLHELRVFSCIPLVLFNPGDLPCREHVSYGFFSPQELYAMSAEIVDSDWAVLEEVLDREGSQG